MASSYLDYRGHTARINDQVLTIIVLLAIEAAKSDPAIDSAIREAIASWGRECLNAPPGLIEIDLSGSSESVEGRAHLESIINSVTCRLQAYGDLVPGSWLNAQAHSKNILFVDTPTELLLTTLDRILDLIRGGGDPIP